LTLIQGDFVRDDADAPLEPVLECSAKAYGVSGMGWDQLKSLYVARSRLGLDKLWFGPFIGILASSHLNVWALG
jgi:hypothetical protein